jgi:hypothetical protein
MLMQLFQPTTIVAAVMFLVTVFLMGCLVWHFGSKLKK